MCENKEFGPGRNQQGSFNVAEDSVPLEHGVTLQKTWRFEEAI
jgi:hypothetical protein